LQGVEPGRAPFLEREVATSASPDKDLSTTVFVKEKDRGLRLDFLHLCEQEIDQRGLAGTRLANDHRVGNGLFAE
jgi:hypothetical protein